MRFCCLSAPLSAPRHAHSRDFCWGSRGVLFSFLKVELRGRDRRLDVTSQYAIYFMRRKTCRPLGSTLLSRLIQKTIDNTLEYNSETTSQGPDVDPKLPQDGWALQSEGDCSDQKDDSNDKVLEALGVLEQAHGSLHSSVVLFMAAAEGCNFFPFCHPCCRGPCKILH